MRTVKYIVVPGYVTSQNDGQVHYISASQLIRLYGVRQSECIIAERDRTESGKRRFDRILDQHQDAVILVPRNDGRYIL